MKEKPLKTADQINREAGIIPIVAVSQNKPVDIVIPLRPQKLTKHEIVRQLKEYDCPQDIIDKLEQWIIDCFFDNDKLGKWVENQK
jgi:predicted DNA-binding protein (UPF0278 family)